MREKFESLYTFYSLHILLYREERQKRIAHRTNVTFRIILQVRLVYHSYASLQYPLEVNYSFFG